VIASAHGYPLYGTERQLSDGWLAATSTPRQDRRFCNNAYAAIKRHVWLAERYGEELTRLEDLAWARRVIKAGYVLSCAAGACVAHMDGESSDRSRNRYWREAIAHRRFYDDQRLRPMEAVGLAVSKIAADYLEAARNGALVNIGSIPAFHSAQGASHGFAQGRSHSHELKRRFYYPTAPTASGTVWPAGGLSDYDGHEASSPGGGVPTS
jgi:GT2 family glycosyltransferase